MPELDHRLLVPLGDTPTAQQGSAVLLVSSVPVYSFASISLLSTVSFSIDVEQASGNNRLKIEVEHQNVNDTSWTSAGSFPDSIGEGVVNLTVAGIKDVYRYKFMLAPIGGPRGAPGPDPPRTRRRGRHALRAKHRPTASHCCCSRS